MDYAFKLKHTVWCINTIQKSHLLILASKWDAWCLLLMDYGHNYGICDLTGEAFWIV